MDSTRGTMSGYDRESGSGELEGRDPIRLFAQWYLEAEEHGIVEPGTMTLATADAEGRPSARMVLLKSFDEKGFVFYTNYLSRKGRQLERNPWAAVVLHWPGLQRQVRIEGRVQKITAAESDRYFAGRPRGSQLGAWASGQSNTITSRAALEDSMRIREQEFSEKEVPRPLHWGGYRLVPESLEFWVGRDDRLHDRVVYEKAPAGKGPVHRRVDWKWRRLAP